MTVFISLGSFIGLTCHYQSVKKTRRTPNLVTPVTLEFHVCGLHMRLTRRLLCEVLNGSLSLFSTAFFGHISF